MSDADQAALDAWLALDRRNRGAYLRAQAALLALEDAVHRGSSTVVSGNDSDYGAQHARPRRRRLPRPLAWVACMALVTGLAAMLLRDAPRAPAGIAAAARTLELRDGSVLTLAADSDVRVDIDGRQRRVTLLKGHATFKVAKDASRPFVVASGQVFAQATGTVYSVRRVGERGAAVEVSEGSVLVWSGNERDQAVLLRAGGSLTLAPGTSSGAPSLPDPDVAQIAFDNEPLHAAISRFNRVNQVQIEVRDTQLGKTRIVGLFRANDPEQFAQAAALLAGAQVERHGDVLLITPRDKGM